MEEVQSNPKAALGMSRKLFTKIVEDEIEAAETNGQTVPDWQAAVKRIFEVSDQDHDGRLSSAEILEIPSSLLVAAMGTSQEAPEQSTVRVDDSYARENGLDPDELDELSDSGGDEEESADQGRGENEMSEGDQSNADVEEDTARERGETGDDNTDILDESEAHIEL